MSAHQTSRKRSITPIADKSEVKKPKLHLSDIPSFVSSPVITIYVGQKEEAFFIHESLILPSSKFFENALSGEWKESASRIVRLPELRPEAFLIYSHWLYMRRCSATEDVANTSVSSDNGWRKWARCYKLGDFLQDDDFKDFLIDMAIEKMISRGKFSSGCTELIYATTTSKSPNRKLVVDITVLYLNTRHFGKMLGDKPSEFYKDVLLNLASRCGTEIKYMRPSEFFAGKDTCEYHEHTLEGNPCYKMKSMLQSSH